MKEISKEEYFQALHECRSIINNNKNLRNLSSDKLQSLKIKVWKMINKTKESIRKLISSRSQIVKDLLDKPWVDSNLDIEDKINELNKVNGLLIHWTVDKSIFEKVDNKIDEINAQNMINYIKCYNMTKDLGFAINPPIPGDKETMGLQLYFIDNFIKDN